MKANKADFTVECEGVYFEGLLPYFEEWKGVTKFLFFVPKGLHGVSEGLHEVLVEESEWKFSE